jgi:hypothetical protein
MKLKRIPAISVLTFMLSTGNKRRIAKIFLVVLALDGHNVSARPFQDLVAPAPEPVKPRCTQVGTESQPNPPVGTGPGWYLGLDTNIDQRILGGKIQAYKIQWFNGIWSPWYTPGVNDLDWKINYDGTQRRVWSYFTDHNHIYKICYNRGTTPRNAPKS